MQSEPVFVVDRLNKHFGAIAASHDLSLSIMPGEIHALIGPNGAGKSTAIHQFSGELQPDSGQILFEGQDITHWSADMRARGGIARTYQITSLFPEMSVRDNLAMAVQSRDRHHFRFWSDASTDKHLNQTVERLLAQHELSEIASVSVAQLAHGQQRQVELALLSLIHI